MTWRALALTMPLFLLACVTTDAGDTGAGSSGSESGSTSASGGSSGSSSESCMPGEIDACLCPDQTPSTRICLADGMSYSECDCTGGSATTASSTESATSAETTGPSESSGDGSSEGSDSGTDASSSEGPPPECDGSHPLVDGDLRYCEMGNCYCGDFSVRPAFDVCYAEDIAQPCCPVEVVCY